MKKRESENIQITVDPAYIPERSDPTKPIYMFSYRIKFKNTGAEAIEIFLPIGIIIMCVYAIGYMSGSDAAKEIYNPIVRKDDLK